MGWAFTLAAAPVFILRRIQGVSPVVDLFPPEPAHEWTQYQLCRKCGDKTEHFFIEYRDEPVVTKDCLECGHQESIWDYA